jgi:TolA-binding protein
MLRLRAAELTAAPPSAPRVSRLRWSINLWRLFRPKSRSLPSRTTGGQARLGLLGRLAMAPQVAMGTVMSLIVLVGLWALPQLTRRRTPRFENDVNAGNVAKPPAETETSAAISPDAISPPTDAPAAEPIEPARKPMPPSTTTRTQPRREPDLEAGLAHYRSREYAQATPLFSRALSTVTAAPSLAQALLYLARSERALGHCDRAVTSYETLVHAHPGRQEAQAALREGVSCYDRLSEPARAQHLLDAAATTPELASGARSLQAQRTPGAHKTAGTAKRASASARND